MMTLKAFAVPTEEPITECIGVLNVTHTLSVDFTAEDCAWAQTCASLVGSLHASFFARFATLEPEAWSATQAQSHPNEVLLERSRSKPSVSIDRPSRSAPSTIVEAGSSIRDVTKEELEHERIVPWVTLREEDYLINSERLGAIELDRIRANLTRFGIARIRLAGHAPDSEIIEALGKCIGPVAEDQNEVLGKVKSIKPVQEKPANTGDSVLALGAHVDGTQHESTPAVLIFQYVHGASFGALSQFWDAAQVFLELDLEHRQRLMSALAAADAGRMSKNGREYRGALLRKVSPTSVGFRFRIDDVLEVNHALKEDFERLKARFSQRGLEYTPLKGDIAVFDNRRLLHGRDKVGGDEQREHRRMWIEEIHPDLREKIHLGIRPVAASIMAKIDDHGTQRG
jgi:alpha-ketoglutarate-dependent taurine dioxygenase